MALYFECLAILPTGDELELLKIICYKKILTKPYVNRFFKRLYSICQFRNHSLKILRLLEKVGKQRKH